MQYILILIMWIEGTIYTETWGPYLSWEQCLAYQDVVVSVREFRADHMTCVKVE
jgi:hypothetical protein